MRRAPLLGLVLGTALAPACGGDRSGAAAAARDATASVDSTKFGDDRAAQGDTARVAPDVVLLEGLVDQYEGLDVVMDELAGPTNGSPAQGHAWSGDRHEDAAKARLLDLLQREFGERYQPRTPAETARLTDSIGRLPHEAGTRALDALVLTHHRRAARSIAAGLPSVRNARVRAELVDLSERLRKEIEKLSLRRPANGSG